MVNSHVISIVHYVFNIMKLWLLEILLHMPVNVHNDLVLDIPIKT